MATDAEVLILGTFHMANPGRDVIKFEADDVLAPHRQAELDELTAKLARFEPTKVCVERPQDLQDDVDAAYQAYRDGSLPKKRKSEEVQVAFRLAARCGLDTVHAIDDDAPMRWDGLEHYLAEHAGAERRFQAAIVEEQRQATEDSERLRRQTISEFLLAENDEAVLRKALAFYIDMLGLGGAGEHGAAAMTASWYERNIRIFSNLAGLTEPGDRIFVLFGTGHVPILRHLAEASSRHRLVDAAEYLVR